MLEAREVKASQPSRPVRSLPHHPSVEELEVLEASLPVPYGQHVPPEIL